MVTQGLADEYLHLMARNNELMNVFESLSLNMANVEVLSQPVRDVKPEVLRPIMQAARQQKRLDVDYVSLNHPDREGRIIVPHTLVYTGMRWHVRAWCEKNQEYRDFVLSRFRGIPEIMDDSPHGVDGDGEWNTRVTIRIAPDPRLTRDQQEVVETDFGMENGVLEVSTRGKLVPYALKLLHIDPKQELADPMAQQIIVENRAALLPWPVLGQAEEVRNYRWERNRGEGAAAVLCVPGRKGAKMGQGDHCRRAGLLHRAAGCDRGYHSGGRLRR
jgi:hypothetical protein